MAPQMLPMIVLGAVSLVLAALAAGAMYRGRQPVRLGSPQLLLIVLTGLALAAWGGALLLQPFSFGEALCLGRRISGCSGGEIISLSTDPGLFWFNTALAYGIVVCGLSLVFLIARIVRFQARNGRTG
jgi:hypothetical protein